MLPTTINLTHLILSGESFSNPAHSHSDQTNKAVS